MLQPFHTLSVTHTFPPPSSSSFTLVLIRLTSAPSKWCGSCWSQAVTSSLSDRLKIANIRAGRIGADVDLSPQVCAHCTVYYVLCAVCCVLCAVCCVLRAVSALGRYWETIQDALCISYPPSPHTNLSFPPLLPLRRSFSPYWTARHGLWGPARGATTCLRTSGSRPTASKTPPALRTVPVTTSACRRGGRHAACATPVGCASRCPTRHGKAYMGSRRALGGL